MKHFSRNAVIVFSKYPEEGQVKTRIARTLGHTFAASFYKICAEHTFSEVLNIKSKKTAAYLFYSEKSDKEKFKSWTNSRFLLNHQEGNDLGQKMFNAFKKVFENGSDKAIIIGTDIPDITSQILDDAILALDESDVTIGPASDGGYYLLGMKNLHPVPGGLVPGGEELFTNIEWSTGIVFKKTIEKIKTLGLSFQVLPELSDVDTEEDLKFWLEKESPGKINPVKSGIEPFYLSFPVCPLNNEIK